jgi:hypothetical protein
MSSLKELKSDRRYEKLDFLGEGQVKFYSGRARFHIFLCCVCFTLIVFW